MNRLPHRRRGLLCLVGIAALAAVGTTQANAAGANLLTNGDFESGTTSGWSPYQSTISVASDGVGGGFAGKASNGSATNYGLRSTAKPVPTASPAPSTRAAAWCEATRPASRFAPI